jgi:hypothetical protein
VLAVDDQSSDSTAAIVRDLGESDPRIVLIDSPPLPARWTGKSHACWIAAHGVAATTQWQCFIDADVTLARHALSSAMRTALTQGLDLLSLMPRQELRSFAERLMAGWLRGDDGALSALVVALAGSGAAFGLHLAATFYFRVPFWYGLVFPLGYTSGALMAVDSVRRRRSGRVSWRGRIYS